MTLRVDQATARKFYENGLRIRRSTYALAISSSRRLEDAEFDMRIRDEDKRPQLVGGIKELNLGEGKTVKIGRDVDSHKEAPIAEVLQANKTSFAWSSAYMVDIDLDFMSHRLNVDPRAKARIHKRRKMAMEKLEAVEAETQKLLTVGNIQEIQYPE